MSKASEAYLNDRTQRACDAIGNKGGINWNLQDVTAVRDLLRELKRLEGEHPEIFAEVDSHGPH